MLTMKPFNYSLLETTVGVLENRRPDQISQERDRSRAYLQSLCDAKPMKDMIAKIVMGQLPVPQEFVQACQAEGIEPMQYLLMLQDWAYEARLLTTAQKAQHGLTTKDRGFGVTLTEMALEVPRVEHPRLFHAFESAFRISLLPTLTWAKSSKPSVPNFEQQLVQGYAMIQHITGPVDRIPEKDHDLREEEFEGPEVPQLMTAIAFQYANILRDGFSFNPIAKTAVREGIKIAVETRGEVDPQMYERLNAAQKNQMLIERRSSGLSVIATKLERKKIGKMSFKKGIQETDHS